MENSTMTFLMTALFAISAVVAATGKTEITEVVTIIGVSLIATVGFGFSLLINQREDEKN